MGGAPTVSAASTAPHTASLSHSAAILATPAIATGTQLSRTHSAVASHAQRDARLPGSGDAPACGAARAAAGRREARPAAGPRSAAAEAAPGQAPTGLALALTLADAVPQCAHGSETAGARASAARRQPVHGHPHAADRRSGRARGRRAAASLEQFEAGSGR
ncbi:hypothetical protein [Streptomyces spirodelae]|uniref:Uncharacterized protein n=1 Tax=Streptomyces spirodelae TaxID=2812904 RepID=A0ABS3X2L2_9ACTN|nr:hypothetical protein [Streptomyces spirodelae]MBO8189623.1 hypothetical protein [Streptomyces spirodelae]